MTGVAPDGSPVEVFRLLPPGPAPGYVEAAVEPGADLLELGCGAGRVTRALAAAGHRVVAVDVAPEMLACLERVDGVVTVLADAAALVLRRRFGGVVLASYLVNHLPPAGSAYLRAAARHVAPGGAVVLQRYDPVWARTGEAGTARVGPVTVSVVQLWPDGDRFAATVRYRVGDRGWEQAFDAAIVDDDDLDRMASDAGLAVDRWLDEHRTWARLVPTAP